MPSVGRQPAERIASDAEPTTTGERATLKKTTGNNNSLLEMIFFFCWGFHSNTNELDRRSNRMTETPVTPCAFDSG